MHRLDALEGGPFSTILADPPWRFSHRTGKVSPEYRRHARYGTMRTPAIAALPVADAAAPDAHLYLWVPNALLADGLEVMAAWGFTYKANLVWHKVLADGTQRPAGRGLLLPQRHRAGALRGAGQPADAGPGRRQVNLLATRKREHSRKPEQLYDVVEACSPGPYLELFARYPRLGWTALGRRARGVRGDRPHRTLTRGCATMRCG